MVTVQKRTAKPFFDVEKDPIFALPAMIDKYAYFVSYRGVAYPMDISSSPASPGESWPLLTDNDKHEGWRPGGWQPVAYYAEGHLMFVLMHRGGEWTQRRPGAKCGYLTLPSAAASRGFRCRWRRTRFGDPGQQADPVRGLYARRGDTGILGARRQVPGTDRGDGRAVYAVRIVA